MATNPGTDGASSDTWMLFAGFPKPPLFETVSVLWVAFPMRKASPKTASAAPTAIPIRGGVTSRLLAGASRDAGGTR